MLHIYISRHEKGQKSVVMNVTDTLVLVTSSGTRPLLINDTI